MKKAYKNFEKPSQLAIMASGVVSSFQKMKKTYNLAPRKIGSYTYLPQVSKNYRSLNYSVGIYRNKRKNCFVKTYRGSKRTMFYHFLRNEFVTSAVLSRRIRSGTYAIRVPRAIEWIEEDGYASAVFEYVRGKQLSSFSDEDQVSFYRKILGDVSKVSKSLSRTERSFFIKRTESFYYVSVLFFTCIALLKSPSLYENIFTAWYKSLRHLRKSDKKGIVLNHRDLIPQNIFVVGRKIYLLDLEQMAYTYKGYDLAYIMLFHNFNLPLVNEIQEEQKHNYFFYTNYLALHRNITHFLKNPSRVYSSFS